MVCGRPLRVRGEPFGAALQLTLTASFLGERMRQSVVLRLLRAIVARLEQLALLLPSLASSYALAFVSTVAGTQANSGWCLRYLLAFSTILSSWDIFLSTI